MEQKTEYAQLLADAMEVFHNGFACSESVIFALRKHFGWAALSDDAIAMSTGFPWGLGGAGCLCGALAGGTMCLGYAFGRRTPGDPCAETCQALACELAEAVRGRFGSSCCGCLIQEFPDRNTPERKAKCAEIVSFCAETAARILAREQEKQKQENQEENAPCE